jgi:hypothetical protein
LGWGRKGEGSATRQVQRDWRHGREGAGLLIVLDVVPNQVFGEGTVGEGLGSITQSAVAPLFRTLK